MKNLKKFVLKRLALVSLASLICIQTPSHAVVKDVEGSQGDFERSIGAVVRNKKYDRAGKLELGASFGFFPYDLAVNHTSFGGRLTWHISDHYGWEIIDYQKASGSTSSFITSLVSDPTKSIQDLQVVKLKQVIGSNFLLSPFYGKIRFFGAQVLYFDIYVPIGLGFASTETSKYSISNTGGSVVASGSDLTLTLGVGFKLYLNSLMGIVVDLRNYMANSQNYGEKSFRSNFVASFGLAVFLPSF
jgi:outer membrane beta-barrel protein